MTSYATSAEYTDYTGRTAPSDIDALLRRASRQVDRELLSSIYDDTDEYVVQALRDATCEQADFLREKGYGSGAPTGYGSVKIGSVSLDRGGADAFTAGGTRVPFSGDAFTILQTAGLTGQAPETDSRVVAVTS